MGRTDTNTRASHHSNSMLIQRYKVPVHRDDLGVVGEGGRVVPRFDADEAQIRDRSIPGVLEYN